MKLEQKHYDAMKMYLTGVNISEIAKRNKIHRSTVYYWLADKDFAKELQKIRSELQTSTKNYVESNVRAYIDEIEELALDKKTSSKVRADLLKYLVNRVLGNTTVKTELEVKESEDKENFDLESFIKSMDKEEIE